MSLSHSLRVRLPLGTALGFYGPLLIRQTLSFFRLSLYCSLGVPSFLSIAIAEDAVLFNKLARTAGKQANNSVGIHTEKRRMECFGDSSRHRDCLLAFRCLRVAVPYLRQLCLSHL